MTSVAPVSPQLCGAKRSRQSPEGDFYCSSTYWKRTRGFQALGPTRSLQRERASLHQILSIFPGMDEKVRGRLHLRLAFTGPMFSKALLHSRQFGAGSPSQQSLCLERIRTKTSEALRDAASRRFFGEESSGSTAGPHYPADSCRSLTLF
jgi:hypothetical protein